MKTYDDISIIYDETDISYDGYNLLSYIFNEISHKSENVFKSLSRVITETFSKTEYFSKMFTIMRTFTEILTHTEVLTRVGQFFRTFTEKITKIDTWKGLMNGVVIFFNRTKPSDSTFTNRTKPSDSIWTNRLK